MDEKKPVAVSSAEEINEIKGIPIAPVWKRVLAFIVDYFLLSLVFGIIFYLSRRQLIDHYVETSLASQAPLNFADLQEFMLSLYRDRFWVYTIFDSVLWAAYFTISWKGFGQTLGAFFFGIHVVPMEPSLNSQGLFTLTWKTCLIRFVIFYAALQFYGIPFIFLFNPVYKQRIQDFFSGTLVVAFPQINEKESDQKPTKKNTRRRKK